MKLWWSYIEDSKDLTLKISKRQPNSQLWEETIIYIGKIICPLVKWRITNKFSFLVREDVEETSSGGVCQIRKNLKSIVVIDINGGLTNFLGHPISFTLSWEEHELQIWTTQSVNILNHQERINQNPKVMNLRLWQNQSSRIRRLKLQPVQDLLIKTVQNKTFSNPKLRTHLSSQTQNPWSKIIISTKEIHNKAWESTSRHGEWLLTQYNGKNAYERLDKILEGDNSGKSIVN